MLEYCAKNPTMTVEVGELRLAQFAVEFGRSSLLQEIYVCPIATNGGSLRVANLNLLLLLRGGMPLLFGIHLVAIDLVIPPGVAEISRNHVGAGMDVAHDALARRN